MSRCATCNGTGTPIQSGPVRTNAMPRCPEPHVAVRGWICAVPEASCMAQCESSTPHDPALLRIDQQPPDPPCGERTVFHDPTTVVVWCETHEYQGYTHTSRECSAWLSSGDAAGTCRIVVRELGAVLGEVAT